jgi:steroid delta-isomerase
MNAKQTIEEFWRIQDQGDYTALVALFAEDAVVIDPVYGTFEGREAIRGFMEKMNEEMKSRNIDFVTTEIDGGGDVAWAQWTARTPDGDIAGCGLYRVRKGQLVYYKDYMNAASKPT